MGVDLAISAAPYETNLAYNRLDFQGRFYGLWDAIHELAIDSEPIMWYTDRSLETRDKNPHGDPIQKILAKDLAHAIYTYRKVTHPTSSWGPWDLAIVAFVEALPENTFVYLWFH